MITFPHTHLKRAWLVAYHPTPVEGGDYLENVVIGWFSLGFPKAHSRVTNPRRRGYKRIKPVFWLHKDFGEQNYSEVQDLGCVLLMFFERSIRMKLYSIFAECQTLIYW